MARSPRRAFYARQSTDAGARDAEHDGMNINALVIEDERADRVVVRQTLANTDAGSSHLEYAGSLAAGLARLSRGGIDVVLLDLSLPDSEGHATLRALQDAAPLIPLLVIAGATGGASADGIRQFILRDQADCHRLAHVLRSVIRHGPPQGATVRQRTDAPHAGAHSESVRAAEEIP